MSTKNSNVLQPYEVPDSLWSLIKQYVNESEIDDVKSAIGESLVDTTIELHNEIETLLEIWRDYRHDTLYDLDKISRVNSSKLPEPPEVRERLTKEIEFFIKQMREKFDDRSFSRQLASNNHNLDVISYVINEKRTPSSVSVSQMSLNTSRPVSALSRQGAETPCKLIAKADLNTRSMRTTVEYNLDENKLNCFDIDDIVNHLRSLLQSETDNLLSDIDFLYECIDKESEYRSQSKATARQPSLNELKEERRRLEEHVLPISSANMRNMQQQSRSPSANSISSINLGFKTPSPTPLAPLDLTTLSSYKTAGASSKASATSSHSKFTPKTPLYNNFVSPSTKKPTLLPTNKIEQQKPSRRSSGETILNLATEASSTSLLSTPTNSTSSILMGPLNKQQKAVEKFRHMVFHSRETT
jgi:hypothetical protein